MVIDHVAQTFDTPFHVVVWFLSEYAIKVKYSIQCIWEIMSALRKGNAVTGSRLLIYPLFNGETSSQRFTQSRR